jgi:hypothetical protein
MSRVAYNMLHLQFKHLYFKFRIFLVPMPLRLPQDFYCYIPAQVFSSLKTSVKTLALTLIFLEGVSVAICILLCHSNY